jgi:hypothetical protein
MKHTIYSLAAIIMVLVVSNPSALGDGTIMQSASAALNTNMVGCAQSEQNATDPLVGVWTRAQTDNDSVEVLRLQSDGRGLWVKSNDGDINDRPVRWASEGNWTGLALSAQMIYDVEVNKNELSLTSRDSSPETITFTKTHNPEHMVLLPAAPESDDAQPSAVGVWLHRAEDSRAMLIIRLDERGIGMYIEVARGAPIGAMFRWKRENNTIRLAMQAGERPTYQLRFVEGTLKFSVPQGKTLTLERTDDQRVRMASRLTPMAPEPPRGQIDAQGAAYYADGPNEAIFTVTGDEAFTIGAEQDAPAHVQNGLNQFRNALKAKRDTLTKPRIVISPDGKSVVLHGFREDDQESKTFFWPDWRHADKVDEYELYFRGGGRFLSTRFVYSGEREVWDRSDDTWYKAPPVDVLKFDVAGDRRWVGLANNKQTVRLGRLTIDGPVQEHEFKLDGYAREIAWARDGAFFLVDVIRGPVRIFNADGEPTATLKGEWRLKAQVNDSHFFVSRSFANAALMEIQPDGAIERGEERKMACRADRASPSGKYVTGLGPRRSGDRYDVDRTPLCDPQFPLPPRPPYGTRWIAWDDDE